MLCCPQSPSLVGIAAAQSFVQNAPVCDSQRELVGGLGRVSFNSAVSTLRGQLFSDALLQPKA
jgi:hypothetical protein